MGKYRLIENFPGYGYAGDVVEVKRIMGELVVVTNGLKQFCVEKSKLSLCPVHLPLDRQKSQ